MNETDFSNIHRVTIMGLGLFGGGLGAAEYWAKKGAEVLVTDLRDAVTLAPSIRALEEYEIEYVLEQHREEDFTECDLLIVNPAVQPENKFLNTAINAGVPLTTEIGLFINEHQKLRKNPILAVTGSNGKSTTTALLSSILAEHDKATLSGGNIGGSLLSQLGTYTAATPAVLELSSFQLHYLARDLFKPEIAIITNLAPNHLDWHKTIENYYHDKKNIINLQDGKAYAVLNYNDPVLRNWAETMQQQIIFTSIAEPDIDNAAFRRGDEFIIRYHNIEHQLASVASLQLPGRHNQENALQALAAAFAYNHAYNNNSDEDFLSQGLNKFTGLPHRQEVVGSIDGVLFVNDSIATTPESTIAALNSYAEREIVIIAGGYDKKISLSSMSREIVRKAKSAILIGQTAPIIYDEIKSISQNFDASIISGNNLEEIVATAWSKTKNGVVLLSPGCASYGMFVNFQERGAKFSESVKFLNKKTRQLDIM